VGAYGWVARCVSGDALFPAQDAEDEIPSGVLGHCVCLGSDMVECVEWWDKSALRNALIIGVFED
jgi:hypothetical protein